MNALLAALAICLSSEITIPPSSEPYRLVPASVDVTIPDGATIDGGWVVDEGVDLLELADGSIILTAAPGEHIISYVGDWLHIKPVTFKDGDGQMVTIQSYLGHGQFNESATFTVLGGTEPEPPKPEPPLPGGSKSLVFFLAQDRLDSMPFAQSYMVTSRVARKKLADLGHTWLLAMDDNQIKNATGKWAEWAQAVEGHELPAVGIAPSEGGEIVVYPMPPDFNRLLILLGEEPL